MSNPSAGIGNEHTRRRHSRPSAGAARSKRSLPIVPSASPRCARRRTRPAPRPRSTTASSSRTQYLPKLTDVATRIAAMDAMGVDIQAVSLSPTQYYYWADRDLAQAIARAANERLAELCRRAPRPIRWARDRDAAASRSRRRAAHDRRQAPRAARLPDLDADRRRRTRRSAPRSVLVARRSARRRRVRASARLHARRTRARRTTCRTSSASRSKRRSRCRT